VITWLKLCWVRFLAWIDSFNTPEVPLVPTPPEPLVQYVVPPVERDLIKELQETLAKPLPVLNPLYSETVTSSDSAATYVLSVDYADGEPVKRKKSTKRKVVKKTKKTKKVVTRKRKVNKVSNARKSNKPRSSTKKPRR
jgi:hypothetical protein